MGAAFASAGLASKGIVAGIGATTMANDPAFRTKPILHYLLYIVFIGIGVAVLIYMLMHAHPMVSPKVTERPSSQLQMPGVHMGRTSVVVRGRRRC